MENIYLLLEIFLAVFSCLMNKGLSSGNGTLTIRCIESEKNALLKFREGFNDPSNIHFSSWIVQSDCCKWKGVGCDTETGHVITLDLRRRNSEETLQGEVGNSLLDLPYLRSLDLSLSDFGQGQIPDFIGSLQSLEYLNLSNANFRGAVPNHLGNLSLLYSLDLSGNRFALRADNLDWLHGLSSLKFLDLSGVDLTSAADWLDHINMLPFLIEIRLIACKLKTLPSSLPLLNNTQLEILDLSLNYFDSPMPRWFSNVSRSLVVLKMRRSHVKGLIPDVFGNMSFLVSLDLSDNSLTGQLPKFFGLIHSERKLRRSSLRELKLSGNQLKGSLAPGIAELSELVVLDLASNHLEGIITEEFLNFSHLKVLRLSSNSFVFNISPNWIPPFQLDTIGLQSCYLGQTFPGWLQSQKDFISIDISRAGVSDTVPDWFWNLSTKVELMNLSSNSLTGKLPELLSKPHLSELDMSDNTFHGPLTHFGPKMIVLILAENGLSGTISPICDSLVKNNSLSILDLSSNNLSGTIPDCWLDGENLLVLSLARNMLSGKIPNSIENLVHLRSLILRQNHLSGELPSSLKYLRKLAILDLYGNRFSGNIPAWIGEKLANLMILLLSKNKFHGNIPLQLCQLKYLRLFSLGGNALSGPVPRCISNFLTMAMVEAIPSDLYNPGDYRKDLWKAVIQWDPLHTGSFELMVFDLSANQLSGEIPRELTSLAGLTVLNLSSNHLIGEIPREITAFENLEVLDFSNNHLSCSIPTSVTLLFYLEALNVSYNNLSGKIPSGHQLNTFTESSYYGNEYLCGFPLARDCSNLSYGGFSCSVENNSEIQHEDQKDSSELLSFNVGLAMGFAIGLWAFWFTLLLSKSWRYAYFRFLDKTGDMIYVVIAVKVARLRKLKTRKVWGTD